MKSQVFVVSILIAAFLVSQFSILNVKSQPYYGAWFSHIYVTHGDSEIDLVNGGTAKVYDGQEAIKNLTFYNDDCGTFGADLYTKIYRDNVLVGTSSETYVGKGSSDTDELSTTLSGPATYSYKVELWWVNWGEHLLVDEKEFSIDVVKVWVSNWSSSLLSVERGFESGNLDLKFSNGGTDMMYYVSLLVIDASGLTITPLTPVLLGHIAAGGTKTKIFTVGARGDMDPKDHNVTFRITYDDLRGVAHTETYQANVTVSSNFIRENLTYILAAVAITALCLIAIFLYVKKRKPKQMETDLFKHILPLEIFV